jgi:two-component system response regulator VicR
LYEAYYAGCDDYLYTPFDEKEFLLRVQVLLRRGDEQLTDKSKSPKGELRIQDVVLDLRQRRFVTPQGQAQLTEKQIDLMFFLMSYPDRIFLTEQLLQVVWKSPLGTRGGGDLVRATICNIRRRFSRHNIPEGYILTRKGKGYMFTIPRVVA